MKLLGYGNIVAAPKVLEEEFSTVARQMPVWPANGSIWTDGQVTIIKLGPIE
jgi:hypothetical protein